jgi:hypothetical protein
VSDPGFEAKPLSGQYQVQLPDGSPFGAANDPAHAVAIACAVAQIADSRTGSGVTLPQISVIDTSTGLAIAIIGSGAVLP